MQRAENLAFIEFPEQIDLLLNRYSIEQIDRIIALTPHAEYALERRGIAFKRPEDYYDEYALEEFGVENFDRVEAFCRFFDNFCQQRIPYFHEHGIRPAWSNFYYLKKFFDAVTIRLYALKAIFDEELPESTIIFPRGQDRFDLHLSWGDISLYSILIELICNHRKIVTEKILSAIGNNERTGDRSHKVHIKAAHIFVRWLKNLIHYSKSRFFTLIYLWMQDRKSINSLARLFWESLKPQTQQARNILFCSASYNLYWLIRHFQQEGGFIPWLLRGSGKVTKLSGGLRSINLRQVTKKQKCQYVWIWQELKASDDFREFFCFEEFDWFDRVTERLRFFTIKSISQAFNTFTQALATFAEIQPAVVLFSLIHEFEAKIIAHAAKQKGIPAISAMHGGAGACYLPMHAYTDFLGVDWNFVFAPGVASYLKQYYPQETSPIVTGSPMIENIADSAPTRSQLCHELKLDPNRRVVVYVLTNFDGNNRYISYRVPSDSSLFKIQRRICSVFKNHPEIQFVIKGVSYDLPAASPISEILKDEYQINCKFIVHHPFSKLIRLADMFIVDHPLTTLLQMCLTDTPIYIFNNWLHWEKEALQKLKKRTNYFSDLNKFVASMDSDLQSGVCFRKSKTDDGFLRNYVLPDIEKRSVELMAEKLNELIMRKEQTFHSIPKITMISEWGG